MHLHDRGNTQYNRDTTGPTNPVEVAWTFETGGEVTSSPAVVDESVYIGSKDGNLYALDMGSGEEQWRFETGGPVVSSPAVVDGTVSVGSNDQRVYALDAGSGEKQWEVKTAGAVRSSPNIAPTLYSSTHRLLAIGSDDGAVYFLDADTGETRRTMPPYADNPVVGTPAYYLRPEGLFCSFGTTRGFRYHVAAEKGPGEKSGKQRFDPIYSSITLLLTDRPVLEVEDQQGFFEIIGADDGKLTKFAEFGASGWEFRTDGKVRSSPALADGVVYVGSWDRNVYAIDRGSGEQEWAFETGGTVESSPAVADGALYVGSADEHVYALDIESGEPLWDFETGGQVFSSPAVVRDTVFVGSKDGSVYALTSRE